MTDTHGDGLSPLPVAPVHETARILRPEGLKAWKRGATMVGVDLGGAYRNRDAGFDATRQRQLICNAGLIPPITETPRNRKRPKRDRKRFCKAAIHALRTRVDRTFAGEDTVKRRLRRCAHLQPRHVGMK